MLEPRLAIRGAAALLALFATSCKEQASTPAPAPLAAVAPPPASLPDAGGSALAPVADAGASSPAKALLEAAETLHHFAGEEPYDQERAAFIASRVNENLAKLKALLPKVRAEELPPGVLAAIRIVYDPDATAEQRGKWCLDLPHGDFMESLLDDEARAACGLPGSP